MTSSATPTPVARDLAYAESTPPFAPPASAVVAAGSAADPWFAWLQHGRHGGDAAYAKALEPALHDIRDRVLDHAGLRPDQEIADIGSGDGLVGFGVLDRQPGSRVTFVDRSVALIDAARAAARERGVAERCRFVVASAEALGAIGDASVDVVLVRAVLAYLADKGAALRECRRILRPRGRISIADPIFADRAYALAGMALRLQRGECGAAGPILELLHRLRAAHFPDTRDGIKRSPLTNYDERELLRLVEAAGFVDVHLRLHIDSVAGPPMPWEAFLATSPYGGAPAVGEVLAERFSATERIALERYLRPVVEAGSSEREATAYIFADAP